MTTRAETSPLAIARIAGALYVLIIICAGFAEGYVRAGVTVPGDAAATAGNIAASEGLFRAGLASDLVAFLCDAVVAILLYVLLRPVSRTLSLLAASLRLVAHPAIASVNLINHYMAMRFASGADTLGAFEPAQLHALTSLFLDAHHTGYLIAGVFFGVHCAVVGYLLYSSTYFPKVLGVLLVLAALGYLIESFGGFLTTGHEALLIWIVSVPAVVGEVSFALWLVIKGVNVERWRERVVALP